MSYEVLERVLKVYSVMDFKGLAAEMGSMID